MSATAVLVAVALAARLAGAISGGGEPTPPLSEIAVYPPDVRLETARDRQRVIAVATMADGTHRDVTREAGFGLGAPDLASLEGSALSPLADGSTELAVLFAGRAALVPVRVERAPEVPRTSFRLDVLPVLTARGCNAGSCHGSARGQDGFHLSLFGFDPAGDHFSITRELPERRLDRAFPRASLLLEKPTGAVPHTGGVRFQPGDDAYAALARWIEEGAADDLPDVARATSIEVFPPELVLRGPDQALQLLVRARYSDGTDRDVTDLAVFRTSNESSGAVAPGGRLRSGQPGEAFVTASFGVHTVGVPVIVLPEAGAPPYGDPAGDGAPRNWIDELIEAKHRKLGISPSELCDDETFLRRVYLDVVGLLPTPAERAEFLADEGPAARARLVERLLERKEFSDLWVMRWAELLQIRSSQDVSEKAALLYFEWLRDRLAANTPIDELVRSILTASGGTFAVPQTNYFQVERDNLVLAEDTAQAFLGIRLQCAQCHNHPFDRWTQDDYYGFAAFLAQVGRKGAEDPREQVIFDRSGGEVRHPVGNATVAPKFLGGEAPELGNRDRREVLAEWLTSPENPWFARSLANRVFASLMGPGIIEPVDDFRVSNPPSNGPLLDALAARLVATGYDFKDLVREICVSRAYQRASEARPENAGDQLNYARATVRRLRAETLLDVVSEVTADPEKLRGLPLGSRAVEIADGATDSYFLRTFGRAPRESVAACEVSYAPSLSQALHLLNGATTHEKVRRGGVVQALLGEGRGAAEVIDALYVRALCRAPSESERAALLAQVEGQGEAREALEDVFWALLNSREFLFQH